MDVGELLAFEEDIGALIPGFDSVVLYFGVLGVEDVVLLAEGLGAQEMVGTRRRKDAVGHVRAAHHH